MREIGELEGAYQSAMAEVEGLGASSSPLARNALLTSLYCQVPRER
jgi:hypothetical protein